VKNIETEKAMGMFVTVINTPSCMSVNMNELEILKEQESISHFEISPDNSSIFLYWTSIKDSVSVSFLRTRKFASENCEERASYGYLYYFDEAKIWV